MKKSALILLLFFSFTYVFSQIDGTQPHPRPPSCETENTCPRKTIFHETDIKFGTLGINSINFDQILVCRSTFLISWRIGINYYSFSKISSAGIPTEINFMFGGGALMLEAGLGLNSLYVYKNYDEVNGKYNDNEPYVAAAGRIGVRFQKKHSIFFRGGYTPMYSLVGYKNIPILADKKFVSMFGLSIGYCF
jgi:hypothetical protein